MPTNNCVPILCSNIRATHSNRAQTAESFFAPSFPHSMLGSLHSFSDTVLAKLCRSLPTLPATQSIKRRCNTLPHWHFSNTPSDSAPAPPQVAAAAPLAATGAPNPLLELAYYALILRLTVQPPLLSLLFYFCAANGVATQPTESPLPPRRHPTVARLLPTFCIWPGFFPLRFYTLAAGIVIVSCNL